MLDIQGIITECKKDFTRDRKSVITDFLNENTQAVVISRISKTRGDSIKLYYITPDSVVKSSDYVVKNAMVVIKSLQNNGVKIYEYNKNENTITDYTA